MFVRPTLAAALAVLPIAPLAAQDADQVLTIAFQEREPDDSFFIRNTAPCVGVLVEEVSIDLSTALGGLYFDTEPGEPGYPDENFDGFVALEGAGYIAGVSRLEDGGEVVTVQLRDFETGAQLRFGLDVDDVDGQVPGTNDDASARQMERTSIAAKMRNARGDLQAERGVFGQDGNAVLTWPDACRE